MKKPVSQKTLYRREKGKSIIVSTHLTFSDRAQKVYKILFLAVLAFIILIIIGGRIDVISLWFSVGSVFASIVILIVVPLLITVKDSGKEAVFHEIRENKIKMVTEYDKKESALGHSYDHTKVTVTVNKDNTTVVNNMYIDDNSPVTVFDETEGSN